MGTIALLLGVRNLPKTIIESALETYQLTLSFEQLDTELLSSTPRIAFRGLKSVYDGESPIVDGADIDVYLNPWSLLVGDVYAQRVESTNASLDLSALMRWENSLSDNSPDEKEEQDTADLPLDIVGDIYLDGLTIGYFADTTALVYKASLDSVLSENGASRQTRLSAEGDANGLRSNIDVQFESESLNTVAVEIKHLNVGESDLSGALTFKEHDEVITVTGSLLSQFVQIGEVTGADRRLHQRDKHAKSAASQREGSQKNSAEEGQPSSQSGSTIFTNESLGLDRFNKSFSGQINYGIKEARFRNLYTTDISLVLEGQPGNTLFSLQIDNLGGGRLHSELKLDQPAGQPHLNLTTTIEQVKLQELMSIAGDENTVSGTFSGRLHYESSGQSGAELAGELDGDLLLLAENGQLDAMLVELAGIDIAEAVTLLIKKDIKSTTINCAFVVATTTKGKTTLDDMLVDTNDTVFLGEGYMDLNTERMNIVVKPYPRDFSFFAAPTAIRISGDLSQPSVKPAKTLFARLAAAAALATTATPVAALLPFMSLGSDANETGCNDLLH